MKNLRVEPSRLEIDLGISIPAPLAPNFIGKAYYVSDEISHLEFRGKERNSLNVQLRSGNSTLAGLLPAKLAALAKKISEGFREGEEKILAERNHHPGGYANNPMPILEETGELTIFGRGRCGLGPSLVGLFQAFDRDIQAAAKRLKISARQFPSLIGADTLLKCRYIAQFPHALNLVVPLREDLDGISNFGKNAHWEAEHLAFPKESLGNVQCLLAPSICFHWYESLFGRRLSEPLSTTAMGKCFRYESGNLGALNRLWDFHMREIIFGGPADYVLEKREAMITLSREILENWDIDYKICSATDPFFVDSMALQSSFQAAFDLKFEIQATIPFSNSSIAIGSFNYHQDFFGRSFQIEDASKQAIHTSCVGFGLERVVWAFVCQHGPDPQKWPKALRERSQT